MGCVCLLTTMPTFFFFRKVVLNWVLSTVPHHTTALRKIAKLTLAAPYTLSLTHGSKLKAVISDNLSCIHTCFNDSCMQMAKFFAKHQSDALTAKSVNFVVK